MAIVEQNDEYFADKYGAGDFGPAYLRAMGEPSLATRRSDGAACYRFLQMKSLGGGNVVIRIEGAQRQFTLVAKSWDGVPLPSMGSLGLNTSRPLSEPEASKFLALVDAARFWRATTLSDRQGLDGVTGVLEGFDKGKYHLVSRWSPQSDGPDARFRELCEFMLELGGAVEKA